MQKRGASNSIKHKSFPPQNSARPDPASAAARPGPAPTRAAHFLFAPLIAMFLLFIFPNTARAAGVVPFLRLPAAALSSTDGQEAGWLQEDGGHWRYRLSDGSLVRDGWVKDRDAWYYFDGGGIMAADALLDIHGHSHRFDGSGAWIEEPPADTPFLKVPAGRLRPLDVGGAVYEHPWAGIQISLPPNAVIKTAGELRSLSAHDYIPSYYDLLAVLPDAGILGAVIQYNSDPEEKIIADDLQVFSNFWGLYDLKPSAPQDAVIAGYPCKKISCTLPADFAMDIYLRPRDKKVLYLFVIVPQNRREAADEIISSVRSFP